VAADDLKPTESGSAAVETTPPLQAAKRKRAPVPARAYENRFSVAYVSLAVVVAGAIIGLALVLKQHGANTAAWSSWQPTASGLAGARQIGEHVAAHYRLPSGAQVVAPLIAPLNVNTVPISRIAVRNGTGADAGDVNFYDARFPVNTPYTLCGLGDRCAITEGKASPARGQLIRREALELALYTFRYMHGVDSLLAYLPPTKGNQLTNVVFLRKIDLKPLLDRPLAATLQGDGPFITGRPVPQGNLVSKLTNSRVFRFSFQQIPDGTALVVLSPQELNN
jgi:hypothetical protein